MRPQLLERTHQVDMRKRPESVQLFADQWPRGDLIRRARDFDRTVAQPSCQPTATVDDRTGGKQKRYDQ